MDGATVEDASGVYDGPPIMSCFKTNLGVTIAFGDDGGEIESGSGSPSGAADAGDAAAAGDGAVTFPGTTGKPCKSDADCKGNICELTDPTPVCVPFVDPAIGGNCDPGTDGRLHFCDGPDDPTAKSPGWCLPSPLGGGLGVCVQGCSFLPDGTAIQGCTGNNACSAVEYGSVNGQAIGLGACGGGCMVDSDCTGTNSKCLVDFGLCNNVQEPAGKSACNCLTGSGGGFCAQSCVVSGSGTCPTGTVCDALEPAAMGFTVQNPGLTGFCFPTCAGGTCPAPAQCLDQTAAGPDCQP
jgi:hypothetical protein